MLKSATKRFATVKGNMVPMDGNEAACRVAYYLSDNIFLFPITPSTPMGELADVMNAYGKKNFLDQVTDISILQAEMGAAGAIHGSCVSGGLPTTFTASQGLLLMIPNMLRIAGEMWPAVFHVASRYVGRNGLSIYGDHSDVMTCRSTGFAMLSSSNVQEAHDFALVSHLSAIESSIPFLHFFEGFRTSHEVNTISLIDEKDMKSLVNYEKLREHRNNALNPEHPKAIGTVQQTDIGFQGLEAVNKHYNALPGIVEKYFAKIKKLTGREYHLFDYYGHEEAEHVIVVMGSGADTTRLYLNENKDKKIGLVKVRLYRPFSVEHFLNCLPSTVKRVTVLDRTKEQGAHGEPLFLDVCGALAGTGIDVIGGRFGLHGKEFTPSMVDAVYKNMTKVSPKRSFTVGINDDVTHTSLPYEDVLDTVPEGTQQCVFWGLGSDGTVGANKSAIKIIVKETPLYGQGFFAYSAHKSGGVTMSHLRFGPTPIHAPYEIKSADYIACHVFNYLEKYPRVLAPAKKDGKTTFVINTVYKTAEELEKHLPNHVLKRIADYDMKVYTIDASKIADDIGLTGRINMIMQAVFFNLSGVIPDQQKAIDLLKKAIEKEYKKKGMDIVRKNWAAVDSAMAGLVKIDVPARWKDLVIEKEEVDESKSAYYRNVIKRLQTLTGDDLPVSEFPDKGHMPSDTAKYDKRGIAHTIPKWNSEECIQCNLCSALCPHAAIRPYILEKDSKPPFDVAPLEGGKNGELYRIQISPYDCTGCEICSKNCPVDAIPMVSFLENVEEEDKNYKYVLENVKMKSTSDYDISKISLKDTQFIKPLLEFSGACAGCNETPIVKLATQLFGDQMMIANSTGCSCVWGGTLPFNPYSVNEKGHGPSWGQSLFEDTAEYGYGMFKATKHRRERVRQLLQEAVKVGDSDLVEAGKELLRAFDDRSASYIASEKLKEVIASKNGNLPAIWEELYKDKDMFAKKTQWIIGGDGWAYDIGYGGLDHVIASGENINILILDTEVYSNTGGQASKATPRSGVAKFAAGGKSTPRKDLGSMILTYGNVYVASVCLSANPNQALKALIEAEKYDGVSVILAYTPCIAHGLKGGLGNTGENNKLIVKCGYWPLYRYDPTKIGTGKNPFTLDSRKPKYDELEKLLSSQIRFETLTKSFPELAKKKQKELRDDVEVAFQRLESLKESFAPKKKKKN